MIGVSPIESPMHRKVNIQAMVEPKATDANGTAFSPPYKPTLELSATCTAIYPSCANITGVASRNNSPDFDRYFAVNAINSHKDTKLNLKTENFSVGGE